MGREYKKDVEKLFSEKVDRLITGEELKTDAEMGEDIRSAVDFARKMLSATPKPSVGFEAHLKAKLLQKLAEDEVAEKGWLWRLIPHQPVWQAVAALVCVIIVGVAVWGSGVLNPSEPVITSNVLRVDADTNKAAYAPGETVKVEVTLKNVTSEPFKIEQFPPILSLMQTESRQPVFTFNAGEASKTLLPGEVARFSVLWDQRDDTRRYVPGGGYYLELEDIGLRGQAIKLTLTKPVSFDIQTAVHDIGEIYKSIYLSQSQTVEGITVVLQKLELSSQGARLTAIISAPPDYNQATDYRAFATYYLDRGWIKNAGLSSVKYYREEMVHTWYFTEPIPQETGELLFVIMSTGKWEGPWQFLIPLE